MLSKQITIPPSGVRGATSQMKKLRYLALFLALSLSFLAFKKDDRYFEIAKNLDIYATLFKTLNAFYVDEINPNLMMKNSIEATLKQLDPYTNFYPEDDIEDYMTSTIGKYNGIGIMTSPRDEKTTVVMIYEDTPAYKAGIKIGDEVVKVDGIDLASRKGVDVGKLLKGQTGTEVKVSVRRFGVKDLLDFKLMRDVVKITNVPYYGMLNEEVGYIQLTDFMMAAAKEVRNAFTDLKSKGMKKVIFDLRENPGGLLDAAVDISNIFIQKDQLAVETKGKMPQWNKKYKTSLPAVDTDMPVVVLINGHSASASEIVSGVLQDYDRGVLIGQKSFGKGLVQTTEKLSFGTQLKVTVAKYYIPSGRCIQAIDYSHRKEDGTVGKFSDSLRAEFKTKNGRKVYDGGGVEADIKTESSTLSSVTTTLVVKGLLFDYATKYASEHASIKPAKEFALNDAEFADFAKWLNGKNYDYTTQIEQNFEQLEASAKKEKYFDVIQEQLKALKTKISHSKDQDLILFKTEICKQLEQEIVSRYYLQKGMKEASFVDDVEVQEALKLFKDMKRYENILK